MGRPYGQTTEKSFGFDHVAVFVENVDAERGVVTVRDRAALSREVPLFTQRANAAFPREGETWLLSRELGDYTFSHILRSVPRVVEGSTGGNQALENLLGEMEQNGMIQDATSPGTDVELLAWLGA